MLEDAVLKFMITYSVRRDGLTAEQNIANSQALIKAFSKWKPDEGLKIHAYLGSVSGNGGFILAETDDARTISAFAGKFLSWVSVRVEPVLDISESVGIGQTALAWAAASAAD